MQLLKIEAKTCTQNGTCEVRVEIGKVDDTGVCQSSRTEGSLEMTGRRSQEERLMSQHYSV